MYKHPLIKMLGFFSRLYTDKDVLLQNPLWYFADQLRETTFRNHI